MTAYGVIIAAVLAQVGPVMTERTFRANIVADAALHDRKFVGIGFQPVAEAAKRGRNIKRLRVSAGLLGGPPSMEMERYRDGTVTLTMRWPDRPMRRRNVSPETWRKLDALERTLFETPRFDPSAFVVQTWSSCHGDMAAFQSTKSGTVRQAGANQCRNSAEGFNGAKLTMIAIFAREAMAERPDCARPVDPTIEMLANCFRTEPSSFK